VLLAASVPFVAAPTANATPKANASSMATTAAGRGTMLRNDLGRSLTSLGMEDEYVESKDI
jgi:hypothetical protein